jgi:2,4-dienoyl-CoA reductase-like NADH-dependent reductase (Old Yellow Enzyme family)
MEKLFTPGKIGSLELPNRLVRSATAESMADDQDGRPKPQLRTFYRELAEGGVGLIVTGHMYVHPSGKARSEMTGIYSDDLIPGLAELAATVHQADRKIAVQINHGGIQSALKYVGEAIAPSTVNEPYLENPAREVTGAEIDMLIDAFAQAARRTLEAGFDAVQIHAAHGYLINEFLSPIANRRTDQWGGDIHGRMRFLREVAAAVREQVGPDFPVLIKLAMMDGIEGGLMLEESALVLGALEEMGIDGVELSGGIQGEKLLSVRKGINKESDEGYFLCSAQSVKDATRLPVILVGGFRSRGVMEKVLMDGDADFIALCRPLINEPGLPNLMRQGILERSKCISANNCWAEGPNEGIACHCPIE